jgi:hypothetical protein
MNTHVERRTPGTRPRLDLSQISDPSFYTPDQAQMKFHELLKAKIKQMNTRTKTKIPHFRMTSSPKCAARITAPYPLKLMQLK